MREIKFEAFNPETGVMHKVAAINFDGEPMVTVQYRPVIKFRLVDVILRQFTGLTGRNGVEIYEGDIVTGEYHNFDVDYSKRGAVEMGYTYDSDGYCSGKTYGWITTTESSLADLDECEVIGNIHQNPELLEQSK